jgi:hypothetical protein
MDNRVNLTQAHVAVVALIVVCATLLGALHTIQGDAVTNIYIACLGSMGGHAIGYAAGVTKGNGSNGP